MENEQEARTETATPEPDGTTEQNSEQEPRFTQADLDRAISKAIETREARLKSKFEEDRLREQQQFQELAERRERELQALKTGLETRTKLQELGVPELGDIFELDLGNVEGRVAAAERIAGIIKAKAEDAVKSRLRPNPVPQGKENSPKSPAQMTPEEFAAFKKERGIF